MWEYTQRMGNDQADAVRAELHDRLIRAYGDLKTAASEMGIPYKTLYRSLTTRGKDRTASVSFDLILEIIAHLQERFDGEDIGAVYRAAMLRDDESPAGELVQGRFPQANVDGVDETRRVAKKKSRDRGEDDGGGA